MTHDAAAPLAQHDAEAELRTDDERPLVTFALCAYNQERFIREAIEGAFAQTYEPLEIILSDDCSSDRTFEIMQEMAAAYAGAARIKLNRNASNLGIAGHVNRLIELSTSSTDRPRRRRRHISSATHRKTLRSLAGWRGPS